MPDGYPRVSPARDGCHRGKARGVNNVAPHPAGPIYRLEDGSLVVQIAESTFQIVEGEHAGKIIRQADARKENR